MTMAFKVLACLFLVAVAYQGKTIGGADALKISSVWDRVVAVAPGDISGTEKVKDALGSFGSSDVYEHFGDVDPSTLKEKVSGISAADFGTVGDGFGGGVVQEKISGADGLAGVYEHFGDVHASTLEEKISGISGGFHGDDKVKETVGTFGGGVGDGGFPDLGSADASQLGEIFSGISSGGVKGEDQVKEVEAAIAAAPAK